MTTLIILPTYNEKENLAGLATAILRIKPALQILIVDDNSPDGTGKLADDLSSKNPQRVFTLHRQQKKGLGQAYIAGFNWALEHNYDLIITMDADWSHNPADIPRLISASGTADLVIGSRYLKGVRVLDWSLRRLLLSIFGNYYVRVITRLPLTDSTSGFKCYHRKVLDGINIDETKSNGYSFQIETNYRAFKKGFTLKEVPIIFSERRAGRPKMNSRIALEAFFRVWLLRLSSFIAAPQEHSEPQD